MFPEKIRKQAVEIGHVLKMDMFPSDHVTPKKGANHKVKRFVIIGKNDNKLVAALLINSQINSKFFMMKGPYQHLITVDKYDFLDHDSYIDGFSILEFDYKRVLGTAQYLGRIDSDDMKDAINLVCDSPDVKPIILKKFGLKKQ